MNTEMQSMKDNHVWVLVDLPPNGRTVGSKWLFKKNTDMDGNIHTFKARLVENAIPKPTNKRFDVEIKKIVFTQNPDEPCVYLKASGSNVAFLILYVNDILLMGNNVTMLQEVKSWLCSIMYVVICTRPDVAFAQNLCSRLQQNPGEIYWTGVKAILKYLRNTKDMYIAAAEVSMEAVWIRKFIDGLGSVVPSNKRPMEMLCDNEPAIAMANDLRILKGARHFQRKYHYIVKKVGNGEDTLFWEEDCKGDIAFKYRFLRVYALESNKNITVYVKLAFKNLGCSLRRILMDGAENARFLELAAILNGFQLPVMQDRWFCLTRWVKVVHIKVNVLAWKISLDGLPTRLNLSRRGLDIQSIMCSICGIDVESTSHIFFACPMSREIVS
ncbi:retrovirus-related pol polyprotein from transposon TNT 1-94 [Tanacetum coccineum]|uniref:Retrovirus-related pol polyprotein from transposon TNT 1-94 n=1 Tax=Tanacetum coccineum TaxID=301880 RepID=A0ABQ5BHL9_9ASTR